MEKDLKILPFGQMRDIEFKMVEGDFQLFEGKWSVEQVEIFSHSLSTSFLLISINCVMVKFF